jgi:hypothetical protein
MSKIWVYVAFDGDHIGRQVGRASLADNPDELRRLSQAIEQGNDIWRSWCLSKDGDVISMGGDEGRIRIGADHLGDLPQLRERYQGLVGAAVSVGIGTRLSEADKALLGAKLKGGDQIVLYSPDIDELISKTPEKDEREKLQDEYLNKADGPVKPQAQPALNSPAAGGGIKGPSESGPAGPEAPIEEGSEHSENESLNSMIEDAGQDIHAQLGAAADGQAAQDDQEADQEQSEKESADGKDKLKKQIVSILKVWQDRAKELEGLADQDPDLYKSLVGMMKALIAMSKEYFGDPADGQDDAQGGDIQKSEDCKHFFAKGNKCLKCKQTKDDLDKAALEAGKTGRHDLELPVGSQKDASAGGVRANSGKIKVQHPENGKTSWVSVRAGQVLSQDGHAISSRNPGGK